MDGSATTLRSLFLFVLVPGEVHLFLAPGSFRETCDGSEWKEKLPQDTSELGIPSQYPDLFTGIYSPILQWIFKFCVELFLTTHMRTSVIPQRRLLQT